jgi:uncharacterized membrane protein
MALVTQLSSLTPDSSVVMVQKDTSLDQVKISPTSQELRFIQDNVSIQKQLVFMVASLSSDVQVTIKSKVIFSRITVPKCTLGKLFQANHRLDSLSLLSLKKL